MRIAKWSGILLAAVVVSAFAGIGTASAVNIDWLNMPPTPFGSTVPSGSVFNVAGVGNVTVTYSIPATVTTSRLAGGVLQAGNLMSGAYTWSNFETFAGILNSGPDPLVPVLWTITYTFQTTLPAGVVYVGVDGLGATTSFGGGASTARVNQNGTFLGDWSGGGGPWGPTQYTWGAGFFQMQNSLTAPGGQDPNWNTPLGVVQINDAVSSVTVIFNSLRGDGVGANIGFDAKGLTPAKAASWGHLKASYR
jgi:hypothetical protein